MARTTFAAVAAIGAFASCAPPVFPTRADTGIEAAMSDAATDGADETLQHDVQPDEAAVAVDAMDHITDVSLDQPPAHDGGDVPGDLVDATISEVLDGGDAADSRPDTVDALDHSDAAADVASDVADVTCDANLMTDPSNCGACGTLCPSGTTCMAGICLSNCAGTTTWCGAGCADLQTDPMNCGGCGNACASGVCAAGTCCAAGLVNCSGVCTDTTADPNNCGACSSPCAIGDSCVSGICMTSCIMCGDNSLCCAGTMCCASASIPITYSCQMSCP